MPRKHLPEPWRAFLSDIDRALNEPVVFHCIGGFAVAMLYGLPRPTVDVDCLSVIPAEEITRLQSLAGEGSPLHKQHGVYVQHVAVVTVPENYEERLLPVPGARFRYLQILGLEAHDLALSKLERNSARDREDVKFLGRAAPLTLSVLQQRYDEELRPYLANTERHDLTIRLWLDMLSEVQRPSGAE